MKALAILALSAAALPAYAQDSYTLPEITLTASLSETDLGRTGATVEIVTEDDLRGDTNARLADYLARLPGLSVTSNGGFGTTTSLRIRGLSGLYYKVTVDGIDVSDPSELQIQANLSGMLTDDISRIEVLKGPQSALYGSEAIGGVIAITTKQAQADGFSQSLAAVYGSNDTKRASYTLRHGGARHSAALTVAHLTTDGISAADENDGNTEADPAEATRVSLSGHYEIGQGITVGASAFWQDQEARYDNGFPVGDDAPGYINTAKSELRGARVFAQFSAAGMDHEIAVQRSLFDREFIEAYPRSSQGSRSEVSYQGSSDVSDQLRLSWGASHSDERARFNAGSPRQIINSAFAEAQVAVTPDLDASVALRHDNHSAFGGKTTGRIAMAWRPDAATVIRAQYGTGFRAPSLNELYGDFGANPDLAPETSRGFELGVEREMAGGAVLKATAFDNRIEDLIQYSGGGYNQVPGESRSRGVELTAAMPVGERMLIGANAAYTKATDGKGDPLARVPRRSLNLSLSYEVTPQTTLTGTLQHNSGAYDGGAEMESWTTVGITAKHRLTDKAAAYLRIDNLFDEEYQVVRGYGTADRTAYVGLRADF